MKVLRFVLVLAFIFTIAISPAQAKAGERNGFMPLLTKVNASIPLQSQTRQAFQRLLPKLLALQKNGAILEFQPEFGAGILKIKYAAGASMDALGTAKIFDNIHTAVAQVPHTKSASLRPEVLTPYFYPNLYDSCFSAYNLGNSARIVASLRDKTNAIIANYAGNADTNGYLYNCFNWNGPYTNILPGYTLTYKVYDSTGVTLLGTFVTTAPKITFDTINKATSVIGGTAPANKSYSIGWYHRNLDAANSYIYPSMSGMVSAGTQWQIDFGTTPFRGGDYFYIDLNQTANFTFERSLNAPYVYCELGSNYCGIYGMPLQTASITIVHAAVSHTFTGTFSPWGWFSVNLEDANHYPIFLVPGDQVSGTGIPVYVLPNLTVNVNFTTNVVSGLAPANKYFYVEPYDVLTDSWYSAWVHSNASSGYAANFTPSIDLKAGDALAVEVYYRDTVTGNNTYKYVVFGP